MKKKIAGIPNWSMFKRFLISFLVVLILPIAFFFILFLEFFYQTYEDKIIHQATSSLTSTKLGLDKEIDDLWLMAVYNSQLSYMQDYKIKKNYENKDVIEMLKEEKEKNSIIKNIYYYTVATPQMIYSASGTYSWDYFAEIYLGEENEELLMESLKEGNSSGLKRWKHFLGKDAGYVDELYYVVRLKDEKFWFINLNPSTLREIMSDLYGETILMSAEGVQLFPFEQAAIGAEDLKHYFEIETTVSSNEFQLVRYINKKEIFAELHQIQKIFLTGVVLVIALGCIVVYFLTKYHVRPFNDMQDYCEQKVQGIPVNIEGFEALKFTINKIESQLSQTKEKHIINNLLIQLVLGWGCDTEEFAEKMRENKLFQRAQSYCMIVASCYENMQQNSERLELYLKTELNENYEIHKVNLVMENQELFLLGMSENTEEQLESVLLKTITFFESTMSTKLFFYMGNVCNHMKGINQSYLDIIACVKQNDPQNKEQIIYCQSDETLPNANLYPDVELNLLYEALLEADMNKVDIATGVLTDSLMRYSDNGFFYCSIYYDILNTYYRAQERMSLNMESALQQIDFSRIKDNDGVIQLINDIKNEYKNCIMQKINKTDKNFVIRVMEYIDENRGNSEMNVSMVADHFEMSVSNLSHRFKLYTNQKISDYITEKRFEYAGELIKNTDYRISDIATMFGYTQTSNFIRKFKQYFGVTPVEYREM